MLEQIKIKNVLFLDIETVPIKETFEDLSASFQKLWEEKILCIWHQKPIHLTKKEFNILRILIRRPNIVHTRAHIMDILSDDNLDVSERSVDSHIKRLRRKFMEANQGKIFKNIKSFYGFGYSWNKNE